MSEPQDHKKETAEYLRSLYREIDRIRNDPTLPKLARIYMGIAWSALVSAADELTK